MTISNTNATNNTAAAISITYHPAITEASADTLILRGRTTKDSSGHERYSGELHVSNLPMLRITPETLAALTEQSIAQLETLLQKQQQEHIRKLFATRAGVNSFLQLRPEDVSLAAVLDSMGATERNSLRRADIEKLLSAESAWMDAFSEYALASNWQEPVAAAVLAVLPKIAAVNPPVDQMLAKKLAAHVASINELAALSGQAAITAAQMQAKLQAIADAKAQAAANLADAL